jgi:uncharacterized protein YndB with AHSA1/START domain
MTRVLEAPRDLVFAAWTNPKHVAAWWGPNGFTTTTHKMDVRPGGSWRFIMHGPDGVDYPNRIDYLEVDTPRRLVYDHGDDGGGEQPFHVTVTFDESDGGTVLTMRLLLASPEERERVVAFGAVEGGQQTLARLADYLPAMANRGDFKVTPVGDLEVEITRVFDFPRQLVFTAMSSCEHLRRWMGPRYLTMSECEMDFRPGGFYRYVLRGPDGSEHGFRGEIREIVPPERIVQTFVWDEMPDQMLIDTITLVERDGKTYLTARSLAPTAADRDGIVQSGMEEGARDSYDRLEDYLATLR